MRWMLVSASSVLLALSILWPPCLGLAEERDCTWGQANYDQDGWLVSVRIFRGKKAVATINHMQGMDFYWIQCNGVSPKEVFNTANDAAWAACWRCR